MAAQTQDWGVQRSDWGVFRHAAVDAGVPVAAVTVDRGRHAAVWGSGVLIAGDRILTAKHVVAEEDAVARSGTLARDIPLDRLVRSDVVTVRVAATTRRVVAIDADPHADLALLRLDRAIPAAPIAVARAVRDGASVRVHAQAPREGGFRPWQVAATVHGVEALGGVAGGYEAQIVPATPEGTSGGPVVLDEDGRPMLAGLVSLGAEVERQGKIILAGRIAAFLARHGLDTACPLPPIAAPTTRDLAGRPHRMLRLAAGTWRDDQGWTETIAEPVTISAAPLDQTELAALLGESGGDPRVLACPRDLSRLVAALPDGWTIADGPTLVVAWRIGGAQPKSPVDDDLQRSHLAQCRFGLSIPPLGAREWTSTETDDGRTAVLRPMGRRGDWRIDVVWAAAGNTQPSFQVRLMIRDGGED